MARVTIDDCLEKIDNHFSIVLLASQLARMQMKGMFESASNLEGKAKSKDASNFNADYEWEKHKLDSDQNSLNVTVLKEVASGRVKKTPKKK